MLDLMRIDSLNNHSLITCNLQFFRAIYIFNLDRFEYECYTPLFYVNQYQYYDINMLHPHSFILVSTIKQTRYFKTNFKLEVYQHLYWSNFNAKLRYLLHLSQVILGIVVFAGINPLPILIIPYELCLIDTFDIIGWISGPMPCLCFCSLLAAKLTVQNQFCM